MPTALAGRQLSAAATVAALASPARCLGLHPCPAVDSPPLCHAKSCGSTGSTVCSHNAGLHHTHCFSAPTSPAGGTAAAAAAAAAARAVDAEVRALRSARRAYQRAALGQQDLCTSVARTIHEALKQADAPGSPAAASLRPRSADVGIQAIARRRKCRRDLTAELQGFCGGVTAS